MPSASALLALLNAEAGQDLVFDVLAASAISSVNLAEVVTRLSVLGMPEGKVREALSVLSLEIIPFHEEQAFHAGLLAASTRSLGLSLGDRACLALAHNSHAAALTADRAWTDLDIGVKIKLIR